MSSVTQKSLLPKERSDELIITNKRKPNWKTRFKNFLKKDGIYNFAKIAVEARLYTDDYSGKKYGRPSAEVFGIFEDVWNKEVSEVETIEEFLGNCKINSNYQIKQKSRGNIPSKNNIQKRRRGFGATRRN